MTIWLPPGALDPSQYASIVMDALAVGLGATRAKHNECYYENHETRSYNAGKPRDKAQLRVIEVPGARIDTGWTMDRHSGGSSRRIAGFPRVQSRGQCYNPPMENMQLPQPLGRYMTPKLDRCYETATRG